MAVSTYDNLSSITIEMLKPVVVDNILDSDPMLMRLLSKAIKGSGTAIHFPIKYAKNTSGGSYAGYDTLTTAEVKTRTRGNLDWKQFYQSIVLSNIDKAKNSGKEAYVDLVKQSMSEGESDLKDKMITGLYSDGTTNSSKTMTGLQAVCDDQTNVDVYAGITRSNNSFWEAQYSETVGSITLANIGAFYDSCKSGADMPTIMVTTETLWTAYEALLQPNMRYNIMMDGYSKMNRGKGKEVTIGKGKEQGADGGFSVLFFRGTPIVSSEYATSGNIFFLNENYLDMYVLPQKDRKTDKYGFAWTKPQEPTNQDATITKAFWYGNLVCTQCRKQGRMAACTA